MLKWPDRAAKAVRKLFEPLQEIDVYVEDKNDEAFYRALFKAITREEVKIARVFSLGGRTPVVNAAKNHNHKNRRALFIVDGDLQWTKGTLMENHVGLHRHQAYCIENLLICEKGLAFLISQENVLTEDIALQTLKFDCWINLVQEPLIKLFAAYATLHDFKDSSPTVSQGINNLCTPAGKGVPQKFDLTKVEDAITQALKEAETAAPANEVALKYHEYCTHIENLPIPLYAVSGKDFLIPLIDLHLQSLGCRIKRRSLRLRLACAGDLSRFDSLKNALHRAAQGFL